MKTKKSKNQIYRVTYVEQHEIEFFISAPTKDAGELMSSRIACALEAASRVVNGEKVKEAGLQDFAPIAKGARRPKDVLLWEKFFMPLSGSLTLKVK